MNTTRQVMVSHRNCRTFALLALAVLSSLASGCQWTATGQNVQGRRLFEQGQYAAALQQFQRAVTTDPQNADAFYNMGRTYHTQGNQTRNQQNLDQADAYYAQCLEYDPNHVDCRRAMAVRMIEKGQSDQAFNMLKSWAAANPQSRVGAEACVEVARLYSEFGDKETARLYLNQAQKYDLNNSRAWKSLAWLQESEGKYADALANYQRSVSLNHMQPGVVQRIATLQRTNGIPAATSTTGGATRTVNNPHNPQLRY